MAKVIPGPWGGSAAVTKTEAAPQSKERPKHDFPHRNAMLAKLHIAKNTARICTVCGWLTYVEECPNMYRFHADGPTEELAEPCSAPTRPLTELDYRHLLKRNWNKTSAAHLTQWELNDALILFKHQGFVATKKTSLARSSERNKKGMAKAAEEKARIVLGPHWEARLNGWVKKVHGVDSVYFLTTKQLRAVFGFLGKVRSETEPF